MRKLGVQGNIGEARKSMLNFKTGGICRNNEP